MDKNTYFRPEKTADMRTYSPPPYHDPARKLYTTGKCPPVTGIKRKLDTPDAQKPGIMIVQPRLKNLSPEASSAFLKWTKLHFRDLLNLSPELLAPSKSKITAQIRFVAPHDREKGHDHFDDILNSPYLYNTIMNDIRIVKTREYDELSRALDLESTRPLLEDEEPVGWSGNVFDVCNATFAVYEEVKNAALEREFPSFQQLFQDPSSLKLALSPHRSRTIFDTLKLAMSPHRSHIITIIFDTFPNVDHLVLFLWQLVRRDLGFVLRNSCYVSLYTYAGIDAQPNNHPLMPEAREGSWLMKFLLVRSGGPELPSAGEFWREYIDKRLEMAFEKYGGALQEGAALKWGGIWMGDLFMMQKGG